MTSKIKDPPKFYGIGEWFGEDISQMLPQEREESARLAISRGVKIRPCPFKGGRKCNKVGGVCSVRRYVRNIDGGGIALGNIVTTCPSRFFDAGEIFEWVGEVMLGTSTPRILGEIPFLQKLRPSLPEENEEEGDFIGRIDNILVHPGGLDPLAWCALEMQAVYFSGAAMSSDFNDIAAHPKELRFPAKKRRPDFRSSGPKRLLPQLQTKVPELSRWGKKMAICVDETFFSELVGIEEVKHLSNADLAWFVVRYEAEGKRFRLRRGRCVFAKLDSTIKALTGGVPLPQETFESQIRTKLRSLPSV